MRGPGGRPVNRASAPRARAPQTNAQAERTAEHATTDETHLKAPMLAKATSGGAARERRAMLALVDELASLAAGLWFAGKLDHFAPEKEPADGDDD
jgi:hypothetical protein